MRRLLALADRRNVRVITMPLEVLPPSLVPRLERRVFVTTSIKKDRLGARIGHRLANWRVRTA